MFPATRSGPRVTSRSGAASTGLPDRKSKFKRSDSTGFFIEPAFHVGENNSRGDASLLTFLGEDKFDVKDARYTTCVADNNDWFLSSADVELDKARSVGTAHNATVYFKDVPILYSPYLTFPLSNERKSGFLPPIYGSSNQRGFEIALPYYLNLAPNYDATLLARPMSRRGLQMGAQGRYLFQEGSGEVDGEFLPHDRITGTNRWAVAWKHNQNFGNGLSGFVNTQEVSDDTYFADLSDRLALTSQTNLPHDYGLSYNREPLSLLARWQSFQTLQDPNAPITPPYFREPQVAFTVKPVEWHRLDFAAAGEFVRFHQPALSPNGNRSVLYPTVAWSQQGNAWFFTAQTGLHMTNYDLDNVSPHVDATTPSNFNRVLPINTVDTGLVFERDTSWFGRSFIQTLEPRLYYVQIPYRNQSTYPELRHGDRRLQLLAPVHRESLSGQRPYRRREPVDRRTQIPLPRSGDRWRENALRHRAAVLLQKPAGDVERAATHDEYFRPACFRRGASVRHLDGCRRAQYQLDPRQTQRLDLGARYQPGPGRVVNIGYRFIREYLNSSGQVSQLKQIDSSGQVPFLDNWSAIGRWNYSLVDGKTLEGVLGFEYNGDCWVFRIAAQRLQTNTQQVTTAVFVQLELNGLARLGTNPGDVLRRSVPGYSTANDPALRATGGRATNYFPEF